MQKKRRSTGLLVPPIREACRDALWLKGKPRGALASAACALFSLTLAACGGGVDSNSSPVSEGAVADAALGSSAAVVTAAIALKMNTSNITPDSQTDSFIVKYKTGTPERASTSAVQSKLDRQAFAFPARAHHLRRLGIGADVVTTERKLTANEAKAFMRSIATDPNVEYVEPDFVVTVGSIPNDPSFSNQWGLLSNLDLGQPYAGIRVANAWNTATGAGVTIALVDNGVTSHSDLNGNISPGGIDFTFAPSPGDGTNPGHTDADTTNTTCPVTWHGTHVAGIMSALANNNVGIAGIAPSAKVLSARALDKCGIGTSISIVEAMVWAAGGSVPGWSINSHPAKIINLSLGSPGQCSKTYQDTIDTVNSLGATIVVAAMNDNRDASNSQPANCHGVITVGNVQRDGSRGSLSNYGPTVDIAAPGTDILSTYNNGTYTVGNESYASLSGTSMATPMVSGVIALAQSVAPVPLSSAEMRTLIQQNAQPFPKTPDQPLGAGIVDAAATVAAAKSGKIPVAADFKCTESASSMNVTCTDLSTARGGVPIKAWLWDLDTGYDPITVTQSLNPFANYEYPGIRQIKLTVTDANGATSTLSRPFNVVPPSVTIVPNSYNGAVALDAGRFQYYELDVPAGATNLTATLTPLRATDEAWFYIKAGTPSNIQPDCQQGMANGSPAICTIVNPTPGPYYVIVSSQSTLMQSTLTASYK